MVELHLLVKSTTRTKASLFDLHLLVSDDPQVRREAIPDVLVLVVDEDLVVGVNRPLVFAVATVSSIPSSHRRVSTQAITWINTSHQAFTIQDFFITNHVLITEVLILDELNHNFAKSVSLLDAESFVSYDTLDQDLPDVSWIGISGLKTKQGRLQGRQVLILCCKRARNCLRSLDQFRRLRLRFLPKLKHNIDSTSILTPPQHNKNPGLVLSSFKHEFLETDCSVIVKLTLNRRNGMCGILGCSCFL